VAHDLLVHARVDRVQRERVVPQHALPRRERRLHQLGGLAVVVRRGRLAQPDHAVVLESHERVPVRAARAVRDAELEDGREIERLGVELHPWIL